MQNRHHRPVYTYSEQRIRSVHKKPRSIAGAVLLFAAAGLMICSWIFLRDLSTQIAVSDACDFVTQSVSKTVNDTVTAGGYGYDYFETLEKNDAGEVVAVSSNMFEVLVHGYLCGIYSSRQLEEACRKRVDFMV